ncbi:esterase-like activity of phytase family protein [Massilia sp. S19_KUP03_FR1]|uniref:esterase-like activity of phytase family protein n=1 Tax=Massilia sp. S19_KUP03_FR1 TaxID=3025503 RepID=UPI002FCDD30D
MRLRPAGLLLAASLLAACAAPPGLGAGARLRFIGEQRIAHQQPFQGTLVGGLSGIDYDARRGSWVMASDDRAEHGAARFYSAHFDLDATAFRAVTFDAVHAFMQPDGSAYPSPASARKPGDAVPDIEAIRVDPDDGSIWYTSEGNGPYGMAPFVRQAHPDGAWRTSLPMPARFCLDASQATGPRSNLSFEGLAFAPDGRSLWLAMEAPLLQDGALADTTHGALTRLSQFDRTGQMLAQYAYPLDAVQALAAPGRFSDNGVADLLMIDAHTMLVLERSGVQDSTGVFRFYIRLYIADLAGADDIRGRAALAGAGVRPMRKRLLLNLNASGLERVDNIEGMAWGPLLAHGRRSLVLVSDDNFSASQVTQLLAYEVRQD